MGKRANGEGSIYQRKDGRWCAVVSFTRPNGLPGRKPLYGKTQREVREKLTKLKAKQDQGVPVHFARQTVAQFLTDWLTLYVKPTRKPKTYVSYEQIVRVHVLPAIGGLSLDKLRPEAIQKLLNEKASEGKSSRTVQYIHAVLRSAFNKAVKLGHMERNVATVVETPMLQQRDASPFSPEQAGRFLESIKDDRLEALFRMAVSLGMRQGEILGLKWQDVDLTTRAVRVRRTLQRIKMPGDTKSSLVETEPKRKSRRDLPMPLGVQQSLLVHRERQEAERLFAGERWVATGYVFTTALGTPLDDCNLTHRFKAICKSAGLPIIRFHDLRHTTGTFLHLEGASPFTIQQILGHSQLSTTRRYTHVVDAVKEDATRKLDEMLSAKTVAVSVAVNEGVKAIN